MSQHDLLSIIIPVFNEANTVDTLLKKVIDTQLSIEKEIIIIESNSTDGTKEIIQGYENRENIHVFYQPKPQGKGNALKLGFQKAKGSIVLIQDGDLEYDPGNYQDLINPILKGEVNFILGSRHLEMGTHKFRKFEKEKVFAKVLNLGQLLFTTLFNILYQVKLTDPATMFKVFRRSCIDDIDFKANYFDLDWEIVAKLIRKGFVPTEIPVDYQSRSAAEGKKIKFFRDGTTVFLAILRFRFFN